MWKGMFGESLWKWKEVEIGVWKGILNWKWWKGLFWRKVLRNVGEYKLIWWNYLFFEMW